MREHWVAPPPPAPPPQEQGCVDPCRMQGGGYSYQEQDSDSGWREVDRGEVDRGHVDHWGAGAPPCHQGCDDGRGDGRDDGDARADGDARGYGYAQGYAQGGEAQGYGQAYGSSQSYGYEQDYRSGGGQWQDGSYGAVSSYSGRDASGYLVWPGK
jgi:hypothetical protein